MNILDKFHHWRRRKRWNKQYRRGRWESLKNKIESKRYYQLVDFMREFGVSKPTILDLGCGDGVLNSRMEGFEYEYFLGVDFSSVSIEKAKAKHFKNAQFIAKDIIAFRPDRNFDVIIFNEAFYYIPEEHKQSVLDLLIDHLTPNGILITSIFREGLGCWNYFKENNRLRELAFTNITTEKEETYWKMGVYAIRRD